MKKRTLDVMDAARYACNNIVYKLHSISGGKVYLIPLTEVGREFPLLAHVYMEDWNKWSQEHLISC